MPNAAHEILVMLLREQPDLLWELLKRIKGQSVPTDTLHVIDSTVRFADVKEVRPDLLFVSTLVPWVAVEVQQSVDEIKRRRWPMLASLLLDEHEKMGELFVITPSLHVARWARCPIVWRGPMGTRLSLRPQVILINSFTVEKLLDKRKPSLALIASWAMQKRHGMLAKAIVRKALKITEWLPKPLRSAQERAILQVISRRLAEELMMRVEDIPESKVFKKIRLALEARGEVRGEARGEARGKARSLIRYLEQRGIAVTAEQRAKIEGCTNLSTLETWLDRAFEADSPQDIVKALFGEGF